jgi:hypothetical protein
MQGCFALIPANSGAAFFAVLLLVEKRMVAPATL